MFIWYIYVSDDGFDYDGDGARDAGDGDDDNDGALDGVDSNDNNPNICSDVDNDTCDDCSTGSQVMCLMMDLIMMVMELVMQVMEMMIMMWH